jgi:hypothetical protein
MKRSIADSIDKNIPEQEILERRFKFIQNDLLRTNVVIAFRYIIFLISLEAKTKTPGPILYALYKDIILYTASIVESCLNYAIGEFIKKENLDITKIFPFEWKYEKCNCIYEISSDKQVIGAIQHKKYEKLSEKTQFKTVNEIALKSKLLNEDLFKKAEKIRDIRNHIHLAALTITEDFYKKSDVDEFFNIANLIINHIEEKIS